MVSYNGNEPDNLGNVQPDFLRDFLGLVTGYGLLTVEKNEHRQMRRMMNPAFSLPNLTSHMPTFTIPRLLFLIWILECTCRNQQVSRSDRQSPPNFHRPDHICEEPS
jgi:hypothetical protein